MGWPICNSTLENMKITEESLTASNDFTLHDLLIYVASGCTGFAVVLSISQIALQITNLSRLEEQRAIIRILLMVPVYSGSNLLAIIFYTHAIYWYLLGNAYAAIGLASFYQLLTSYIAADLHSQKQYFRSVKVKPWGWPISWFRRRTGGEKGLFRAPRSGLTFFNITFVGVFQYCFVLISTSIIAAITQHFKRYCKSSLHPAFGHIWIITFNVVSAVVSGYCLSQFHRQLKDRLKEHKTTLKMFCVEVVLYLSTYQSLIISLLAETLGLFKASYKLQTPDLTIGIPSTILCFEMGIVATLHLWAYSSRSYRSSNSKDRPAGEASEVQSRGPGFLAFKAIFDALNPWDLVKAVGRSLRWMVRGLRTRHDDNSYGFTRSQEYEMKDDSGRLLTGSQKSIQGIYPVTQEVTSNDQIGAHMAEVDVTEHSAHMHDEDMHLMIGNHSYHGSEMRPYRGSRGSLAEISQSLLTSHFSQL